MEQYNELALKKLCCTCLSHDRKLFQLCRTDNGVNNLYLLLSFDSDAYREGFYKDTASLFVCWECRAILWRLAKFRRQVCFAQRQLALVADRQVDISSSKSLSHLAVQDTSEFETITSAYPISDNFIDCGPAAEVKSESEEDIPLSELYNNVCNYNVDIGYDNAKNNYNNAKHNYDDAKNNYDNYNADIGYDNGESNNKNGEYDNVDVNSIQEEDLKLKSTNVTQEILVKELNYTKKKKEKNKTPTTKVKEKKTSERKEKSKINKTSTFSYQCPECSACFANKNHRWKHVQKHHREGHTCDTCHKRFAFRNNLKRHLLLHQGPLPREECATCHKMVRTDLMKVHMATHSSRQRYHCALCRKRFVSRATYEHHLKYTLPHASTPSVLKYKCDTCDKGYRSRGELRDHVNYRHLGTTRHKCPVCGKALATRRCITRHVKRAHEGVKESAKDKICQQCGKAFRDKKGLREHELIHSGLRPLRCGECGSTFRQSASLYTHRKRVHRLGEDKTQVRLVD